MVAKRNEASGMRLPPGPDVSDKFAATSLYAEVIGARWRKQAHAYIQATK